MREILHGLRPEHIDVATFLSSTIVRLVLAALLGGIIGLEREIKRRPAGLRTNMFICFGAAMFTILSDRLAGHFAGDHTRIAAQIIPGIGFIGAGSILHSRGSVTGLTTAATLFVVASIGMAAGGGEYLPAIFATLLILVALNLLGWFETRFGLKPLLMAYQVTGEKSEEIVGEVNKILEEERHMMESIQVGRTDDHFRVQFTVDATRQEHQALMDHFRRSPVLQGVESVHAPERE